MSAPLALLPVVPFAVLLAVAAVRDATSFTIPNWISLALVALFPASALAVGLPLATIGLHAGVGVGALVIGMVMFALRWVGGGDAKLAAAAALWLGWPAAVTFALYTGLAGGALALGLITLRSAALRPVVLLGPRWMVRLSDPGEGAPYGVAIAIGALCALPASALGGAMGL